MRNYDNPYTDIALVVAGLPAHYRRDVLWALGANNYTLVSPNTLTVNVNNSGYRLPAQISLGLSVAASWDTTTGTNYTVAANRAGKDFYIYACQPVSGSTPVILVSANASAPSGYTTTNSRQIGGFHCLCASMSTPPAWSSGVVAVIGTTVVPTVANGYWYRATVAGTASGSQPTWPTTIGGTVTDGGVTWLCESAHSLAGYVAGDILSASIWDIWHRPSCAPQGMVYDSKSNLWVDIYLTNNAANGGLSSVYGGTLPTTPIWNDMVDWAGSMGKRLPYDHEFQLFAAGSPEMTNISTGAAPATTGNHADTASRRILSWIGCEDCTGTMLQWLLDQASINELNGTTTDANSIPGGYNTTVYYVGSPTSAPIYMKYDTSGAPYFCCAAANAADARISFGSGTAGIVGVIFPVKYDASAASGGFQVYYNSSATSPMKWLANLASPGLATSAFIQTCNPQFTMRCIHDASASSHGRALYWNSSNSHLECNTASGANDTFSPAAVTNAFYWTSSVNQILPGNKGQLSEQGVGGSDVKLVAGGSYADGVNAGTRCRYTWYSRMDVFANQAARFCCPPKGAV